MFKHLLVNFRNPGFYLSFAAGYEGERGGFLAVIWVLAELAGSLLERLLALPFVETEILDFAYDLAVVHFQLNLHGPHVKFVGSIRA